MHMDKQRKRSINRLYAGLLIGIFCHAILIGKALPYAFVPLGSVFYVDGAYTTLYFIVLPIAVFVGIPLAIWDALRHRRQRGNGIITFIAIATCLLTFFEPHALGKIIGDARQIRTPCYPCDGGETTIPGLYLVH